MNWKVALGIFVFACAVLSVRAGDHTAPNAVPADKAAQQAYVFGEGEYRMGPEDVVEVFVWKDADITRTVPVRPDGKISLPLVGEMAASGKTATELQDEVAARLKKYISDPVVTVTVKEVNSPKISVLGQVRKPDRYRIKQRITVLEAVAMAGGFTDFAKRDKITIIRPQANGEKRMQVDLNRLLKDGSGNSFYLQPFDTVYVE